MFFLARFQVLMVMLALFQQKSDYKIGYLTQNPVLMTARLSWILSYQVIWEEIQLIREYELLNYEWASGPVWNRLWLWMDSLKREIESQGQDGSQ